MKALTTEKKTDGQTYNRAKSDQDSVSHKHEVGQDFVGSGYYPPERFVPLLTKFSHPANATQRVQLFNQLQRQYGNRYVQRVVAAYRSGNVEEEESTLASEIISRKGSRRAFEPSNLTVQRLFKSGAIQAKLKIGEPGDVYEQEADRVAEQVMRMQEEKKKEVEEIGFLQTKEVSNQTTIVTPGLESNIKSLKRGGQPLPESLRAFFEPRFGYDFSRVRVHTDAEADRLARSVNAVAFTTGQHIFFRADAYNPSSEKGMYLLAHEATHTVQQAVAGTPAPGIFITCPFNQFERAAEQASSKVQKPVQTMRESAPLFLQRQVSPEEELKMAGEKAATEARLSPEAAGMMNIADVSAARVALKKVQEATAGLKMAQGGEFAGESVKPKHLAANTEVEQLLGFYLSFTSEETRTGIDFMDRYKKAHSQFARLQGMAQQYVAMTGVSALTSKGLLETEAAAKSAKEARKKFDEAKARLRPEQAADITAAQSSLSATETSISNVKKVIRASSSDARIGYRNLVTATSGVKMAAESETAKEKEADVKDIKEKIAELQRLISGGARFIAETGGAMAKGGPVAAGGAAISETGSLLKKGAEGVSESMATAFYESEMARAKGAVRVANTLVTGYAKQIGGNNVKNAADKWKLSLTTLHDMSGEFDRLQKKMRDQILDLGRAMKTGGIGKEEGARYNIIAEFRAEVTLFVNEAGMAIYLGKQMQEALKEGGERRGKVAYGKSGQYRAYYDVYRFYDGRWRLRYQLLMLGLRQAGGMVKTTDLLVQELESSKESAEKYRQVLASAMGSSV